MGAWGSGILMNDSAADGMGAIDNTIADDLARWATRRPAEANAAPLGAAVGLFLQFSHAYYLTPGQDGFAQVRAAIDRQEPAFDTLPRPAAALLRSVRDGGGPKLSETPGRMPRRLGLALFEVNRGETGEPWHPRQCQFRKRYAALFRHPAAAAYAQTVAGRCARAIDEQTGPDGLEEIGYDDDYAGPLAYLLVIEPCRVDPKRVARWRKRVAGAAAEQGGDPNDDDSWVLDFAAKLDTVFRALERKFSVPA
jgi:hypothetical protein